jgi:hypothetical protein
VLKVTAVGGGICSGKRETEKIELSCQLNRNQSKSATSAGT